MLLPGGGGCPAYDVLVEDLPFDFLQPPMQKQVTQAGYGGPYVIRNNPIGAIWDAIRGFCFPATMQATSDGNLYMDTSGAGVDSAGYPVTDTSGLGYGGYNSGLGGYTTAEQNCINLGGTWNASAMSCAPASTAPVTPPPNTGGGTNTTCDYTQAPILAVQAGTAWATKDIKSLCAVQASVAACAQTASVPGEIAGWKRLSDTITSWLQQLGCDNCATCMGNMTTKQGAAGSNPVGFQSGRGGVSRTTPPTSPATGGMMGPMSADTFTPGVGAPYPSGLGGGGGAPRNAPMQGISADIDIYAQKLFPRLPQMPSPMDMTEGNLGMMPTSEPMGGAFDPRSIGTGGTFSNVRGNIGSLGRQRFR